MKPMVSICTTTYNHEKYIACALDSFLRQRTSFPFEVLVHDDASTDGTRDILRRYADMHPDIVKPLYEDENQYSRGVPINETYNFPRAMGKYIALCEGDDCWTDDDKLQAQVDYMEAHPDCTFCFTNAMIEDQSGARADRPFLPYYERERPYYADADRRYELGDACMLSFAPTASFLFPASVLGAMPACFHDKVCQHGDLKMRLFFTAAGYGQYLHRFTCVYRENVAGSAFAVWSREGAARTAARAMSVVDMLDDVDGFTQKRYTVGVSSLRDRYLYVAMWNAPGRGVLRDPRMRGAYRALPMKRRLQWRLKRALPRSLVDGLKRRAHAKKVG